MAYLEFVGKDEKNNIEDSAKFYEVVQTGSELHLKWGRIGTAGQESTKTFDSEEAATKEAEKLIAAKVKKGYTLKD